MLQTTYAADLRLNEVLHLRVADIDSGRMTIRVEQGKGGQDRYTVLATRLLDELRRYWKLARPSTWLFPSQETGQPLHPTALQRVYHTAKLRAGITKPGGIHGLRHHADCRIMPSRVLAYEGRPIQLWPSGAASRASISSRSRKAIGR